MALNKRQSDSIIIINITKKISHHYELEKLVIKWWDDWMAIGGGK